MTTHNVRGQALAMGPVLLSYDGSDHAHRAVRLAGTLLRPRQAVVLHVPQRPFTPAVAASGRQAALDAGFDPIAVVETGHGRIAAAILAHGRTHDASVIVVGSHGARSRSLVHRADRPALVCPPAAPPSSATEPIFMCYDGSPGARQALAAAGDLLAGPAAIVAAFVPAVDDLTLLRSNLPWPDAAEVQDGLARLDREEAEVPAERAREGAQVAAAAGFVARPVGVPGADASSEEEDEPWRRLLRAAADEDAACIVLGHRLSAKGLASAADGLIHEADRPFLVVPAGR
jgi:nucleotide-binding universal stress UspA family protein